MKKWREEHIDFIYGYHENIDYNGIRAVEWKRADVVPTYKSGCGMEPLNYGNISLISITYM